MRVIAVINQKGGVGKTTSTVNIGAALARRGKKVLLIDLDAQGNLSLHIDRQPESEEETVTYLMLEEKSVKELMRPAESEGLWVVPADSTLGGVEQVLANRIGRETILREAFAAYEELPAADKPAELDFILLDCPPALGVLSANALVAAAEVVIPMQAEYFSLQGMAKLTEVIHLVKERLNPAIDIALVLPCMLDTRKRLTMEVLEEIQRHFQDRVSRFPIRPNVKLAEAPSFGRTIFEHDPECNGAYDYDGVAAELLGVADELLAELEEDEEEDEIVDELDEEGVDEEEQEEDEDEDEGEDEDVGDHVLESHAATESAEPQAAEELEPEAPEPERVRPKPPIPVRPTPAVPSTPPSTRPEPAESVPHEIVRDRSEPIVFEPIQVRGPEPSPSPAKMPPPPTRSTAPEREEQAEA